MPEFLTIGEAADLLRIGRRALYEGLRRGEIAGAEKIGNQWCLRRDKLLRWVYESSGKVGQASGRINGHRLLRSSEIAAQPRLRPFFGYYGGKWRDTVKFYPRPVHGRIVEPFAGSAGYSLRFPSMEVVLCERDPIVAAVWHYLIKVKPSEIRAIPDVPVDGSVDDLRAPQEARWLVGFWVNRGTARPRKRPSKWMRDGIRPGSFWGERVRETIATQVESIRHWQVFECSYEECPVVRESTWFVDPPYQYAGRHYKFGSGNIDYEALSRWCRSRKGQVIVCENEGADWLPFQNLAHVKTTRRGRHSSEVIWSNRPLLPDQLDLLRTADAGSETR